MGANYIAGRSVAPEGDSLDSGNSPPLVREPLTSARKVLELNILRVITSYLGNFNQDKNCNI